MMFLMLVFDALGFWFLAGQWILRKSQYCGGWVFPLGYTIYFCMDFLEYNQSLIISLGPKLNLNKTSLFLELFSSVVGQLVLALLIQAITSVPKNSPNQILQEHMTINQVKISILEPWESIYCCGLSTFVFLKSYFLKLFIDKHPLSYKEITQLKVIKMYLSPCCPTEIELWSESDVCGLSPLGKLIWKFLFHWQHSFLTFSLL